LTARSAATPSQMMAECSERLVQAGLPLWRVGVFVRTLHPEIIGWSFIWKPGEEVHVGTVDFNFRATPEFTFSPLAVVFRDGVEVRADPRGSDSERFSSAEKRAARGLAIGLFRPETTAEDVWPRA
jgi:adenylate cyclase